MWRCAEAGLGRGRDRPGEAVPVRVSTLGLEMVGVKVPGSTSDDVREVIRAPWAISPSVVGFVAVGWVTSVLASGSMGRYSVVWVEASKGFVPFTW